MKNLKIDETKAKQLYKTASKDFKEVLHDTFGEEFFNDSLFDRIKNLDDIYEELGRTQPTLKDFSFLPKEKRVKALSFIHIQAIEEVFNEGWVPNWKNTGEYKYYPYFEYKAQGGWSLFFCYFFFYSGSDGQPAFFKSKEIVGHVIRYFMFVYKDYLG